MMNVDTIGRILYSDDCLKVLNDELALPAGSVDLIYLDPPFNSKSTYNLPFAGKDKDARPVEAFTDTWTWGAREDTLLQDLADGPQTRMLAGIVTLVQGIERANTGGGNSLAAYLINMAVRLMAMRRVLADTGSIYLHCDPTASHYLKLLMDVIFGPSNFRNEIVWFYRRWSASANRFQAMHDILLFYSKSAEAIFNPIYVPTSSTRSKMKRGYNTNTYMHNGIRKRQIIVEDDKAFQAAVQRGDLDTSQYERVVHRKSKGTLAFDVFEIPVVNPQAKERLGYPTQKPQSLLERVIRASSNKGDLILDPFAGCGTTLHAAETLGRRWVGIDISTFAVGLVRNRILNNFEGLTTDDVLVRGLPLNVAEAQALADRDKFEFEKWACGAIGAEGMFHSPGTRGADGGVDGVLKFYPFLLGKAPKSQYAIVQVKGGNVTPDSVKALQTTVDRFGATAGVMVCFNRYMRTVENQRGRATFSDDSATYPVIQGLSIEDLIAGKRPYLPLYGYNARGGRVANQGELFKD